MRWRLLQVNSHISSAPVYNSKTKRYEGFVSLADLVQLVVDAAAAVDVKTVGSMTKLGEVLSVDVTAAVSEVVNISANSPFIPVREGTNLIAVSHRVYRVGVAPRRRRKRLAALLAWMCVVRVTCVCDLSVLLHTVVGCVYACQLCQWRRQRASRASGEHRQPRV